MEARMTDATLVARPAPPAKLAWGIPSVVPTAMALAAILGGDAAAEPPVNTTAVQALEIAAWEIWWGGLIVLVVAAHLLMRAFPRSRDRSRGWPGRAIVVSAVQLLTGGLTLFGMILVSIGYVETDPWAFVVPWLLFWAGSTTWAVLVVVRK
jgi:hypothetical protein